MALPRLMKYGFRKLSIPLMPKNPQMPMNTLHPYSPL